MVAQIPHTANIVPCPDPQCKNGVIRIHNAYSADPLKGEEQICEICDGRGLLVIGNEVAFC